MVNLWRWATSTWKPPTSALTLNDPAGSAGACCQGLPWAQLPIDPLSPRRFFWFPEEKVAWITEDCIAAEIAFLCMQVEGWEANLVELGWPTGPGLFSSVEVEPCREVSVALVGKRGGIQQKWHCLSSFPCSLDAGAQVRFHMRKLRGAGDPKIMSGIFISVSYSLLFFTSGTAMQYVYRSPPSHLAFIDPNETSFLEFYSLQLKKKKKRGQLFVLWKANKFLPGKRINIWHKTKHFRV